MINNSHICNQIAKKVEHKVLCAYENVSSSWQIVKITNISSFYWEKLVFLGQKIMFKASPKAMLKIISTDNITAAIGDTVFCLKLAIHETIER